LAELRDNTVAYNTPLKTLGDTAKEVGKDLLSLAGIKLPNYQATLQAPDQVTQQPTHQAAISMGGIGKTAKELPIDALQKQLAIIDAKAKAFGTTMTDVYADKAAAVKSVIDDMIESGNNSGPVFDLLMERYNLFAEGPLSSLKTGFDEATLSAKKMTAGIVEGIKPLQEVAMTFAKTFEDMALSGASSMSELANATIAASRRIIAAKIKEGIAAAMGQKMAAGPFGIFLAAGAGIAANALFSKILSSVKVPAFAEGGAVSGPMQALVGDNRNAKKDPELIMPFSKMRRMVLKDIIPQVNMRDAASNLQKIVMEPVQVAMKPINLGITGRQIRLLLEQEDSYTTALR
jgi:hypothetical protein